MIRIQEPGIDIRGGGWCPVQAEGTVDGLFAYFRARGAGWTFTVTETRQAAVTGPWFDTVGILFDVGGAYDPDGTGYGGGYMPEDMAERIIREQIAAFGAAR